MENNVFRLAPSTGVYYNIHYNVLLVGAGGTGGYVVPQLARMICALNSGQQHKLVDFVIADGDYVERRNLLRQNFIHADLNKNKAKVMADRYSQAFGVNIGYKPDFIKNPEHIENIFFNMGYGYKILISCVDNNATRQIFHEYFHWNLKNSNETLVYIDSGNEEFDGQVVVGVTKGKKMYSQPIGDIYPDILEKEEEQVISCADDLEENPQNMMANYWAAAIILSYLNNLIVLNASPTRMTTFNSNSLALRSMDFSISETGGF